MSGIHSATVINTLEQLLAYVGCDNDDDFVKKNRHHWIIIWSAVWNRHIEKNGNLPMIV